MSERGEIEVLMPLNWTPSARERVQLAKRAFVEARRLLAPTGGRVLGISKMAFAQTPAGERALRYTFACLAPEGAWHQRQSHAVKPT
jgi:hypothetical protein